MNKLLLLTLMLVGVLPALGQEDQATIKATLDHRYKEWIAAANKKDAGALTNFFDDNAVLMPPREEPVLGKGAIGEWYKKLVADPQFVPFTETLASNSFYLAGDTAIDTTAFDGVATREGKDIHFHGKNLIVWKKQKDGSWKIFRYMWDEIPAKK
jgi:ketosteroid isomerase-like protein